MLLLTWNRHTPDQWSREPALSPALCTNKEELVMPEGNRQAAKAMPAALAIDLCGT